MGQGKGNAIVKPENPEKCFGCGPLNREGLQLSFTYNGGLAKAETCLPDHYQGYPGIAHGGIVSTLLDEAMAQVLMFRGILAVTARLEVRFKKPVPLQEEIRVRGEMDEKKSSEKIIYLSAWIEDEAGTVLALGQGMFMDQTEKIVENKEEEDT